MYLFLNETFWNFVVYIYNKSSVMNFNKIVSKTISDMQVWQ